SDSIDTTGSEEEVRQQLLKTLNGLSDRKEEVAQHFMNGIPGVKSTLLKDAEFILESDPAATTLVEVLTVYPGFFAIFCYRFANILIRQSVKLLPRFITEYAHSVTGIDIHPGASIGVPFAIDHGTGIVIGETTSIGNYVKMYQGVTLGALSVEKSKASKKRHPTIEDNVILYSGCTILGGNTVVGRNSIIGGNVWLTESVPPFSVAYHKSQIVVKDQSSYQDPINFII
ncbi:MAG: serine acetyltransferase, partial [Bacteroidales bacterium]